MISNKVFEEEKKKGDIVTNRLRYFFTLLVLISAGSNASSSLEHYDFDGIIINLIGVLIYFFITIIHTIILKKGSQNAIKTFSWLTIVIDFAIITFVIISWYKLVQVDNFNFFLKNSTIYYYILPILITSISFNIKQVIFSISIFIILYYSLVIIALYRNVPLTNNWVTYIFGDAIAISDIISTRPVVFICISLTLIYSIQRSINMVKKIVKAEAQKKALSKYFSPSIANEILKNPDNILKGRMQKAAIVFTDIRNFTSLSENLKPEQITDFLSIYRKEMTKIIFKYNGIIDKFIGDGMLAVFGIPSSQGSINDCINSIKASTEMIKKIKKIKDPFGNNIKIGVGIHFGEVFGGNVGFEERLEYTLIGDPVNTASRIETLTKKYNCSIIISESIYNNSNKFSKVKKLPETKVKGKSIPLKIYECIIE